MYSNNPKIYKGKENRLSFACLFLCMMMFLILGVLPKFHPLSQEFFDRCLLL